MTTFDETAWFSPAWALCCTRNRTISPESLAAGATGADPRSMSDRISHVKTTAAYAQYAAR
jgi:hypothetical protein